MGEVIDLPLNRWANCHYLYVIGARQDGPLKVGVSKEPDRRLATLQTGNPDRLCLYTAYAIRPDDLWLEHRIHVGLQAWRRHGEWFALSLPCLIEAIFDEAIKAGVTIMPGFGHMWDMANEQAVWG